MGALMPRPLRLLLACAACAAALYEEPPGGCKGPPDDFEMYPMNPDGPKAIRRPPRPPPPQAPPTTLEPERRLGEAEAEAEESQAELQRQAYEKESADILLDEDEDWEAIERAHNRELFVRLCVQVVASLITLGFVVSLLWTRYAQLQAKRAPPAAAEPAAAEPAAATTLKVDGMSCDGCRGKVEKALAAVEGVSAASVDLKSEQALVSGAASAEALIAAVEAAGKKATLVARVPLKAAAKDEGTAKGAKAAEGAKAEGAKQAEAEARPSGAEPKEAGAAKGKDAPTEKPSPAKAKRTKKVD